MDKLLYLLKKEDGENYSLTRLMAAVSFLLLMLITVYDMLTHNNFSHYTELCAFTTGMTGLAVGSKVADYKGAK